jgi:hypothetical protein
MIHYVELFMLAFSVFSVAWFFLSHPKIPDTTKKFVPVVFGVYAFVVLYYARPSNTIDVTIHILVSTFISVISLIVFQSCFSIVASLVTWYAAAAARQQVAKKVAQHVAMQIPNQLAKKGARKVAMQIELHFELQSLELAKNGAQQVAMYIKNHFELQLAKLAKNGARLVAQLIKNHFALIAPVWVPDDFSKDCQKCDVPFTLLRRRHHCRLCGALVCNECSSNRKLIPTESKPVRVCDCA